MTPSGPESRRQARPSQNGSADTESLVKLVRGEGPLWTLQEAESGRATYKRASAARGGGRRPGCGTYRRCGAVRGYQAFWGVHSVDDLTLDIYEGEFFSLLGPSGCGKTTTLRMIAGFEEPTEGGISVAGDPVRGVPPYRRPVNTVFQSYAIFPHLNVFDNVAFGLRRAG